MMVHGRSTDSPRDDTAYAHDWPPDYLDDPIIPGPSGEDRQLVESLAGLSIQPSNTPNPINTLNTCAPTDTSNEVEEIIEDIAGLFIQPRLEYDCSRFYKLASWHHVSPSITLVKLKTALLYVTQTCSLYTSSCMLKLDRQLIELVTTQGLKHRSKPQPLSISSQLALSDLPQDTRTVWNCSASE
ncbi:hypothetical protein PGT21_025104 [Puccinia graminis f. sp. tritici]|uniref:Uncharacterized protein n=1 Tax=Puccinia graminis f. sp. tritici TaxID=56615 RepID=A0A5B0PLS1_PUCGR|nr:hypothetical protein PGT21_025104 [Puccinia graminis f. sp. tritici]